MRLSEGEDWRGMEWKFMWLGFEDPIVDVL